MARIRVKFFGGENRLKSFRTELRAERLPRLDSQGKTKRVMCIVVGLLLSGGLVVAYAAERSSREALNELIINCQTLITSERYEEAIPVAQQLVAALWSRSPFKVSNFSLVSRDAQSFADVAARGNSTFRIGEPLLFYAEPRHYDFRRDGKNYAFLIAVDFEVRSPSGEVLAGQKDFLTKNYTFPEPVFDLYLNLQISLSGAPKGEYDIVLVFKDGIGGRQTAVTQRVKLE